MRSFYFTMAIIGALLPWTFLVDFIRDNGAGLMPFLDALFANGATKGFTVDLLISSFVFWVFMFTRDGFKLPWIFVAINLFIGLSCALPAYLFFKTEKGQPAT